ncbi:lipopolysaccharide biosynthesis protein [Pseudalkalibacillus caeni]|uniref:Flippase n=1 Tax=Exobacillus caeni TaxID=2574798 RepID=A0A5R9F7M9_9BACL|nr:oligosaccharide flippase family protein [Pseudalkalibacillus caeni]TLS35765.1 hypothetical protein FCL54_18285 [Pseudalkalibacillus caeni]
MRIKHSLINISAGLGNQLIITALSFISRTVFITYLGIEYLGINGLFANILGMLALAEAGIGSSIMYSLYKPVAENDKDKIKALMKLYKNAYLIIAGVVLLLGLIVVPFLGFIVNDTKVENVLLIYLIFLINTIAPYFFIYKHSFLNVCQRNYIVTIVFSVSSIILTGIRIAILVYTQNYFIYLVIESIITILTSLILSIKVDRMYPFLKEKVTTQLDNETKGSIIKNVKAIILQNIGSYLIFGTDSIIISSFVSVAAVGLYSNYKMLIEICRTFANQIFSNLYHSVGNLVAKESIEKIYSVYKAMWLLNFWLYSFFSISLLIILDPFITLWIGSEFLLDKNVLFILMFLFLERGMRNSITTMKTTSGIFHQDRWAPLLQAAINLVFSIILVQYIGIAGVFLGTLVSTLLVPFWLTPVLVYRKVFKTSVAHYFTRYFLYLVVAVGAYYCTNFLCSFVPEAGLGSIALKVVICILIPNIIYLTVFYKSSEFIYLFGVLKGLLGRFNSRILVNRKVNY